MIIEVIINVFLKHYGTFRVDSMFTMTGISSLNVKSHTRADEYLDTHLPHPHLVNHGCLGGNGTYIGKYMSEGRWDMAIEQSIAATKNINFGDTTVVNSMMRDIYNRMDVKFIIADNGQEMSPNEFLEYVKNYSNTKIVEGV
jgi:hypothetical protein